MKTISRQYLALFLILLLGGCASLTQQIVPTTIQTQGANIKVTLPSSNPAGTYILETTDGKVLATSQYTPRPSRKMAMSTSTFYLRPNLKNMTTETSASCLRIRKPDNTFLNVRNGYLTASSDFKVPVLELSFLSNQVTPLLEKNIAKMKSDFALREQLQNSLMTHSAFYDDRCQMPNPGPQPPRVCRTKTQAKDLYLAECFNSNFVCGVAASQVSLLIPEASPKTEFDLQSIVSVFSETACSLTVDQSYGQKSDVWTIARSIGVSFLVEQFIEKLIGKDKENAANIIAGALNTQLCLNDRFEECTDNYNRWMSKSISTFNQCNQLQNRTMDVDQRLRRNQANLEKMESSLATYRGRIKEIVDEKTLFPLNQRVDGC